MKAGLTIGATAREAGVGVETSRFYERQGFIQQPPKPDGSGVRQYPEHTVERIRFIREAQELGFSLREASDLLALRADPEADCSDVRNQAVGKLRDVEQKIERLEQIRAALKSLIASCPGHGGLPTCSILDAFSDHRSDRQRSPRNAKRTVPNPRRKGNR